MYTAVLENVKGENEKITSFQKGLDEPWAYGAA
jgi:hypothetical protein